MRDSAPKGRRKFSNIRTERVDTVAARRSLVDTAKQVAHHEDETLAAEGLHIGSSDDRVASYRGVGLGLYFKVLHWLFWMMMWMMLCSVPYLITINTSVFTDYAHRHDHKFGVKVYDSFQLSSFTFAAIVDERADNGTLQYMNTEIADGWKGPMRKGVFLTWISLVDAGATVFLTAAVALLFFVVDRWLRRVDRKTREAADYSVIVGGLPPHITATEVGEYFERHFSQNPRTDKVMDVVLIRGFSRVVRACKEVYKYEQLKRFVANLETQASVKDAAAAATGPAAVAEGAELPDGGADPAAIAAAAGSTAPQQPPPAPPPAPASATSAGSGSDLPSRPSSVVSEGGNPDRDQSQARGHSQSLPSEAAEDRSCGGGSVAAASDIDVEDAQREEGLAAAAAAATTAVAIATPSKTPSARSAACTPTKPIPIAASTGTPAAAVTPSRAASLAAYASATPTKATPSKLKSGALNLTAAAVTGGAAAAGPDAPDPEACSQQPLAGSMSQDMSREMLKVDAKIAESRELVDRAVREGTLLSKAALVTFNTEDMKSRVCDTLPSGWWSAWFMPRELQLEHGGRRWRVWVRKAAAPDDYRFENLAVRIRTNILIQIFTGAIMFGFIIVCAAFITWLSANANKQDRTPIWDQVELLAGIRVGMAKLSAAASSGGGSAGSASAAAAAAYDRAVYDGFCGSAMPSCALYANGRFPGADVALKYGSEWQFPNATARLLNERPMRRDLEQCAESVSCPASYCLPCYCLGLSSVPTDDADPEFLTHMSDTCSAYWAPFNLQRDGIKVAISLVIAIINSLLTFVLRLLKFHIEKHWTTTDTELSFAVWAYLVKLVNSVAVLLIVNCSTLRKLQEKALADQARWLQRLILDGLYDDFTPEWYAAVGYSIQILMMINVSGPLVRSAVDWGVRTLARMRLLWLHSGKLAAPEEYNAAFRSQQFTLENRISDVLFNVTLALLFGSGMPLCYLIAAVYLLVTFWWDKAQLLSLRQPAQRYSKDLPRFIMQMLPLLLAAHCAFGLWMHTYFKAEMKHMDLVAAASAGLSKPGINALSENTVSRRITQPNGLALLIWLVVLVTWLLFGRWIVLVVAKCMGRCCGRLTACIQPVGEGGTTTGPGGSGCSDVTFEEALSTVKIARMLRGARTYRIHHLTNYRPFLAGGESGRLWAAAQGDQRFTRLTTFRIYVEVEVAMGRRHRTEHREVEMFDVSENVITSATYAPSAAALATVRTNALHGHKYGGAKTASTASTLTGSGGSSADGASTSTPFSCASAAAAAAAAAGVDNGTAATAIGAPGKPAVASAQLSLQPSAALQAAALQQVATLQANEGVIVKRVSLRAVPPPSVYGGAEAVVPPAYELDFKPVAVAADVVAAAAAAAASAASVPASAAAISTSTGAVRTGAALGSGAAASPAAIAEAAKAAAAPSGRTSRREAAKDDRPPALHLPSASSVPVFKLVLDKSPSEASSHRTIASVKSAPAAGVTSAPPRAASAGSGGSKIPAPPTAAVTTAAAAGQQKAKATSAESVAENPQPLPASAPEPVAPSPSPSKALPPHSPPPATGSKPRAAAGTEAGGAGGSAKVSSVLLKNSSSRSMVSDGSASSGRSGRSGGSAAPVWIPVSKAPSVKSAAAVRGSGSPPRAAGTLDDQ